MDAAPRRPQLFQPAQLCKLLLATSFLLSLPPVEVVPEETTSLSSLASADISTSTSANTADLSNSSNDADSAHIGINAVYPPIYDDVNRPIVWGNLTASCHAPSGEGYMIDVADGPRVGEPLFKNSRNFHITLV